MKIPFRYFLAAHVPVWCMVVGLGVVWNPPTAPGNVPGVQILAAPSDRIEGLVIPTRKTGEVSGNPGQMAPDLLREVKYGIILAAADKCGVGPGLAIALGMRESGLVWPEKLHEARGIYQVKDSTARGVSKTLNNRTVWGNAVAGLCYLRQLRDREGSWEAALLSYREGPHRKATSREAHAYVADIMEGM